jgi:hypothetical protein
VKPLRYHIGRALIGFFGLCVFILTSLAPLYRDDDGDEGDG